MAVVPLLLLHVGTATTAARVVLLISLQELHPVELAQYDVDLTAVTDNFFLFELIFTERLCHEQKNIFICLQKNAKGRRKQ